ncbi:adenylate/guanylate cyclase domain-containing protein [Candidatus Ozemobacteraceae bacterium]|nr:adenylate/guanylate cyclase domain-containing protein [Candidatus Ozemobacteraceae bacterium]
MTISDVRQVAGRRVLAPAVPSTGLVAAVWLFLFALPLLFLLVQVDVWLDGEERWRELAVRRGMLDVMRELQPRLSPARRLEDGLGAIEARLGFPDPRIGRSWRAARDYPGLDPDAFGNKLIGECRRNIGCEPVFLLAAGADGRNPFLRIDRSLMDGAPPRAATMQPVWLSVSGWLERADWLGDAGTEQLRRRWGGASAAGLRTRRQGLLQRLFGDDPFVRSTWGTASPFLRMCPGGGLYLAYANFLPAGPKPEDALLGGYLAVFRVSDLPRRFLLKPILSMPDGGVSRRLVVVPRLTRVRTGLRLECAPPMELLQEWCLGRDTKPYSLLLRRDIENLRHPLRHWQPWLRAAFFLAVFGSGIFALLVTGGFRLPLRLRGQIAVAVGVATVLPLLACTGVMLSYLDYRRDIDRERQTTMINERLELLENGLSGHLETAKKRLWRMMQDLSRRIETAPDRVPQLLERIRKSAGAPVALLITQDGVEHVVFQPGISPKLREMAERLAETPRTASVRLFLTSGCFTEADLDEPPRAKLWTRRRRAIADNMGKIDVTTLLSVDGREIDPKFSGITDSILFQFMVKSHIRSPGRLEGLFYVMYRRSDIIRMYFESLERRNERSSDTDGDMTIDFASFVTTGGDRPRLDGKTTWPRAAGVDAQLLALANRALMIPEGSAQELPAPEGEIAVVRSFAGFPGIVVGCARPSAPGWTIWKNRLVIGGWCVYALLLTAFVVFVLTRNFAIPLERVNAAGREVAAGRFDIALSLPTGDEFEHLASEFNEMTAGLREREHLARFVSDEVLATVRADDISGLHPGGERRNVGVLFAHLVGFDRIAAQASVDQTFRLLDDLLPAMERVIRLHGGSLDKVVGDGVMGVFHPADTPAAVRAAAAALGIRRVAAGLSRERHQFSIDVLRVSVGFVTGNVVCGRIGSRTGRLDYTVIGDAVNLAARLEAESRRRSDVPILLDDDTAAVASTAFDCAPLGTITVKGRLKPVRIFGLADREFVA